MQPLNVLYISIEGNTRNFVKNLTRYAAEQHAQNPDLPELNAKEVSEQTDFDDLDKDYFCFVPTYLDGGDGVNSGVKELMTNVCGEYIAYHQNASHLIGVVGSGNRNFNLQYCLTARRYAYMFKAPFIADYELRGVPADEVRIYDALVKRAEEVASAE
ncbi:class Ib ribonucleoside-diphosphate reductase assembly flavoprotein NrdI [Levilactobacillus bambusae]|uniref:Ribonucleotide reductase assembly protein NrdI n=1 Tax=Levilactobacillus bambusae TaxID=2024736 RepID=A0A2V1N0G5_9LACO|nr:class Ib ribonucleoside-diphosphate reductase assembly flavoprotein NrdI [Levilactobacillus bambusae]PWF99865.1 ribonucleotide reductase assembly protein NrdI [Levilactobacillus bambusae]